MAESDTVSNGSSHNAHGRMAALDDVSQEDSDTDLDAVAGRLDTALTLQPDFELSEISESPDTDSTSAASSTTSSLRNGLDNHASDTDDDDDQDPTTPVASQPPEDTASTKSSDTSSQKNSVAGKEKVSPSSSSSAGSSIAKGGAGEGGKRKSRMKNPLKMLKKLTKFDKPKKKEVSRAEKFSEFDQVRIDKLPQVFVVKYLGMQEVRGFCGLHHVRKPVDEMVKRVQQNLEKQTQVELPLVYVVVSPKGLDVREHKLNKQKKDLPVGLVPIDFISYGVQDIKYWRVFTYIVVKELSSRTKKTECHAYLCDSALNARKMALSLGASFRLHTRSLKQEGKPHNFQVELRPPDELAQALTEADCDA